MEKFIWEADEIDEVADSGDEIVTVRFYQKTISQSSTIIGIWEAFKWAEEADNEIAAITLDN